MDLLSEYRYWIEWLGLFSLFTFIVSLILVPLIINLLPEDFFVRHRRELDKRFVMHPVRARVVQLIRNVFGIGFLLAGLVMLVLPGQGIITMIIGISLMDFPRKHDLLDHLVHRPGTMNVLNWIRRKGKKKPFVL